MFDAIDLPKLTSVLGGCNMGGQPQPDPTAAARGGTPQPGGQEMGDAPDGQPSMTGNPGANPAGANPAGANPAAGANMGCQLGEQILALISNLIQQFAQRRQA